MREFVDIGKKIYDMQNPREMRRMVVYLGRVILHYGEMNRLAAYFAQDTLRQQLSRANPFYYEQATRAFFYRSSTLRERIGIIQEHVDFLQHTLQPAYVKQLCDYDGAAYEVWREDYEGTCWKASLNFEPGQRKEGLLSLTMDLGTEHLYQIIFWCARDRDGHDAIWIGAMQGPNMENARDIVKKITKRSFAYRTKNLILYMVQAVARTMGIQAIYAVTNYGYYANNHMRTDRKLHTKFADFWAEAGGSPTEDRRFYTLPLIEPRKTMEEVPTRKRAVYRKRFAFLDEVDAEIEANVKKILKPEYRTSSGCCSQEEPGS